jgi:hypothetical protein
MKGALAEVGVKEPWRRVDNVWITALLDLVEITEIDQLGSGKVHKEVGHV